MEGERGSTTTHNRGSKLQNAMGKTTALYLSLSAYLSVSLPLSVCLRCCLLGAAYGRKRKGMLLCDLAASIRWVLPGPWCIHLLRRTGAGRGGERSVKAIKITVVVNSSHSTSREARCQLHLSCVVICNRSTSSERLRLYSVATSVRYCSV